MIEYLSQSTKCITRHPDLLVCLNPVVLETAYVGYLRFKRQGGRAPDVLSPRSVHNSQ